MAKKFLSSLKIVNLPSDPVSGSEGELYFNTSASVAKIYQAGAGQSLVQVVAVVELLLVRQNQNLQKSGILGIKMILVNFMYMMELIG